MKKISLALLAVAAVLAITPAAMADTFNFTFTGTGVSGAGSLIGTSVSAGTYEITGGSGFFNDGTGTVSINLFPNPNSPSNTLSPSGFFIYDNQVTPGNSVGAILDNAGLLFTESNSLELNLFGNSAGVNNDQWYENNGVNGLGTFAITPTPEPSSLLLLGTGLFGLAFVVFRKAKPSGLVLNM